MKGLFFTTWAGSVRGTKMTVEESVFVEIGDVFAAARHLQSMQNAPASVTLVTEADIDRCGYRTLTEQAP